MALTDEDRKAFAWFSLSLISVVLFIIFVGVFLRSCLRAVKKPQAPSWTLTPSRQAHQPEISSDLYHHSDQTNRQAYGAMVAGGAPELETA